VTDELAELTTTSVIDNEIRPSFISIASGPVLLASLGTALPREVWEGVASLTPLASLAWWEAKSRDQNPAMIVVF